MFTSLLLALLGYLVTFFHAAVNAILPSFSTEFVIITTIAAWFQRLSYLLGSNIASALFDVFVLWVTVFFALLAFLAVVVVYRLILTLIQAIGVFFQSI